MRLVACQQQGRLAGITTRTPLNIDLLAEEGAPLSVLFNLFEDHEATNLRGLWSPWSVYEEGEITYVTPEGPESGDTSERTPSAFGAWVTRQRSQHSEPGRPGSQLFWKPMAPWVLSGKTVQLVVTGDEPLNVEGTVVGNSVEVNLTAVQTSSVPSSLPYRLVLIESGHTLLYIARGQIIFRTSTL